MIWCRVSSYPDWYLSRICGLFFVTIYLKHVSIALIFQNLLGKTIEL